MARRSAVSKATGTWLLGSAVVVLAILAAVLTMLALNKVNTPPEDGEVAPVPTFAQPTPETPSPTPSADAAPLSPVDRSQERFIAVGSGVLWRGTAGACGEVTPLLERSTNGGETWTDVTPGYLGIGQLSRLDSFAGDQAQIVASMGDDCEVQALRTFTQGQFWESYPEVLAGSEYIDPTDAGNVRIDDGDVAAPCADARGLASSDDVVAVVCNGSGYVLGADSAWQPLPSSEVVALALDGSDVLVAHVDATCDGVALTRSVGVGDSAAAEPIGCVAEADVSAPIAIAADDGAVVVWTGDIWVRITG